MVNYNDYIGAYKDFPKEGVLYRDFTPLLENPGIFRQAVSDIKNHFKEKDITKIAAIEAKGFTIGSALAHETGKPLVLIRKPHLTPGKVISEKFVKEYGEGEYQAREGAFGIDDKVLIVYDIMAGAGATRAAINLVERSGAVVAGCAYAIELEYLKGRESLEGYDLFSLARIRDKDEI